MTTGHRSPEPRDIVQRRVADFIGTLPTPPPPDVTLAHSPMSRRRSRRRLGAPLAAIAACLALVLAVVAFPLAGRPPAPAGRPGLTVLPAVQGLLAADVTLGPPGRVLLAAHAFHNPDDLLLPVLRPGSTLVRDTTGTRIRVVREADQGAAGTLVAPDGSRLAVGSTRHDATLTLLDTTTGARSTARLERPGANVVPVGWSADGTRVYAATTVPADRARSGLAYGDVFAVEVVTGRADLIPGATGAARVMPSPDGRRLLLSGGGHPRIVDAATGRLVRVVTTATGIRLDAEAWSPDGRWIVGRQAPADGRPDAPLTLLRFDADRPGPAVAIPTALAAGRAVGVVWTGPDTYLVDHRWEDRRTLTAVDIRTGAHRDLGAWPTTQPPTLVFGVSIARDLAPRYFGG